MESLIAMQSLPWRWCFGQQRLITSFWKPDPSYAQTLSLLEYQLGRKICELPWSRRIWQNFWLDQRTDNIGTRFEIRGLASRLGTVNRDSKIKYGHLFTVSLWIPVEQGLPQGEKGFIVISLSKTNLFKDSKPIVNPLKTIANLLTPEDNIIKFSSLVPPFLQKI